MTEWYSPKDKLPDIPIGQYDIRVYTVTIINNGKFLYCDTNMMIFSSQYDEGEKWLHSIEYYSIKEPDFWCYPPIPPQELIDKLKEKP